MLTALIALAIDPAHAAVFDYRLGAALEYSDNIARSAANENADTVWVPNIGFALSEDSEQLQLQAAGDVEYRHYARNRFDDETRVRLGLRGNWNLLPQRLSWAFEDSLGLQPINTFSADQPGNLQRTHVFVTGPTLALRPSARSRVLTELRYAHTDAQKTEDFNSDRYRLALRGLLSLSPTNTLSLHAEAAQVDFEQAASSNRDYRRYDSFVRYDHVTAGGPWSVDAGFTRLDFDPTVTRPARRDDLPLLRFRAAVEITEISRLELVLQQQASDAAQDLLNAAPTVAEFNLPPALPTLRSAAISADLFEERSINLGYALRAESMSLRTDGYWRNQKYRNDSGLDQDVRGLRLAVDRQLRTGVSLGAFASSEWRDYSTLDRRDRDSQIGLHGDWRWSQHLSFHTELTRTERHSNDPSQPYTDNRLIFSISYRR